MGKKIFISLAFGCLLSSLALFFAFRNVPFEDLFQYFHTVEYFWIVPSTGIFVLAFLLRVFRWQVILNASHSIGFWQAFHPLMIGFMMNCILPARVGEMARPVLLKNKSEVPFATGLATVAAERAFDVVLILLLFAGVLAFVDINPDLSVVFSGYRLNRDTLMEIGRGMVVLTMGLVAGMVLVNIPRVRRRIVACTLAVPRWRCFRRQDGKAREWLIRAADFLVGLFENMAQGFSLLNSPGKSATVFALSAAIWGVQVFSLYILALGCPGVSLSYAQLLAMLIIICFFIALPSVPGFWGLWEAGGIFALSLFGVSPKEAAGFTLLNHVIQMFPVILIGLGSTIATGVNILQLSDQN